MGRRHVSAEHHADIVVVVDAPVLREPAPLGGWRDSLPRASHVLDVNAEFLQDVSSGWLASGLACIVARRRRNSCKTSGEKSWCRSSGGMSSGSLTALIVRSP